MNLRTAPMLVTRAWRAPLLTRALPALWFALWLPATLLAQPLPPDSGLDEATWQQIQELGRGAGAALAPAAARIEIEPGRLDPRLRLAPCQRIEAYLPAGARAIGRTRVGLRCADGPSAWNVFLPITVKVFAPGWAAATALPSGTVLQPEHLSQAEVDYADGMPVIDVSRVVGRTLVRPLTAGQALRTADLKQRQWFAAGDTVQVVAQGPGFRVSGEGQALAPGIEGQMIRVRTDNGRVLSGRAVGLNRVEVQL